jgi:Fe2+ transport system protein B
MLAFTKVPMVVAGNKLDLQEREVDRSALQALAKSWDVPVYETSAKRDWNVNEVFVDLCRQMRTYYPSEHKKRRKRGHNTCLVM